MEIRKDKIALSKNAQLPEGKNIDEDYLPDEVPPEAAYILDEAVFGRRMSDVSDEIGISEVSVGTTLKKMKNRGLLEYSNQRRGRDYRPTDRGKAVLRSYYEGLESPEAEIKPKNRIDIQEFERELVFGDGRYFAGKELQVLLSALHEDYTISDFEEETGMSSKEILKIRDDLEPLIADEGKYTVDYDVTPLGMHTLTHLAVMGKLDSTESEEVSLDLDDGDTTEGLDWGEIQD